MKKQDSDLKMNSYIRRMDEYRSLCDEAETNYEAF